VYTYPGARPAVSPPLNICNIVLFLLTHRFKYYSLNVPKLRSRCLPRGSPTLQYIHNILVYLFTHRHIRILQFYTYHKFGYLHTHTFVYCRLKTPTPTPTLTTTAMQMLPLMAATSFEHRGPQCLPVLTRSTSPPLDQFPVRVCSCPLCIINRL